jgi:hypothetical protein
MRGKWTTWTRWTLHSPDLRGRMDKGERFECREETHIQDH